MYTIIRCVAWATNEQSHRQVWCVARQPLPWQSSDVYRWRVGISNVSYGMSVVWTLPRD